MKYFTLLCVLLTIFGFTFGQGNFLQDFVVSKKTDDKKCDGNLTFWEGFIDKAKKDHPSASFRDLVKYISIDLMNEESDPMFTFAQVFNESKISYNDSHYTYYYEFNGTWVEYLWFFGQGIKYCEMDNSNFALGMAPRKHGTSLMNNNYFLSTKLQILKKIISETFPNQQKKDKNFILINQILENRKFSQLSSYGKDDYDCTKLPKIQAIIDKLDAMHLTVDEWVREFIDELKNSLNSQNSSITKIQNNYVSSIIDGDGKLNDGLYCDSHPEDPRCHYCEINTLPTTIIIQYYEH